MVSLYPLLCQFTEWVQISQSIIIPMLKLDPVNYRFEKSGINYRDSQITIISNVFFFFSDIGVYTVVVLILMFLICVCYDLMCILSHDLMCFRQRI